MYFESQLIVCGVILMGMLCSSQQHGMRGPHHPRGKVMTHHHYRPHRPVHDASLDQVTKLTQDTELLHDADHIREDLGDWVSNVDTHKMTPEELEFHYFKLHDFDNNTKLDGLEILQAIHHTVHYNEEHNGNGESSGQSDKDDDMDKSKNTEQYDFNYFVELIDQVLEEDDLDKDGYLSYIEYVVGRQKDEHKIKSKP